MNPELAGDVVVVVAARGATDAVDRGFLATAAAWVLGRDPRFVHLERSCPHCGGQDHGRPLVTVSPESGAGVGTHADADARAASRPLHVSLSRAGRCVAFALTFLGPVGVDIESVADVSRAGFDAVAFGPAELTALTALAEVSAADARARLWTAKEAALKCTGDGLRVDPRDLTVSLPGRGGPDAPRLAAWRGSRVPVDAIRLRGFDPGAGLDATGLDGTGLVAAGLVGTVAVLAEGRLAAGGPDVRVVPAADIRRHAAT